MKTLIVLLMLTVSALAVAPVGMGPCPQVTSEELPMYIADAIRGKLNDPGSMVLVDWTQPELRSTRASGKEIGWWSMKVTIRARNTYGGVETKTYGVMIENEIVTRCIVVR